MNGHSRIDPDHPLTEAARYVDAYAEEHGLEKALEWLGMGVGAREIAYLGEQRALRAIGAVALGWGFGLGEFDEDVARAIVATPLWEDMRKLLIACYMDGIAIGWKGRDIAGAEMAT